MRKVFLQLLVSVDGYFDGPDHELDWFVVHDQFLRYVKGMPGTIDGILLGRGRRFLDGLPDRITLKLQQSRVSASGVAPFYTPADATA